MSNTACFVPEQFLLNYGPRRHTPEPAGYPAEERSAAATAAARSSFHPLEPPGYPAAPGYSGTETSRLAAQSVRSKSGPLRQEILSLLAAGPRSTRQAADSLRPVPYETVNPRMAELHTAGLIRPSGQVTRGPTGKRVICWELVPNPPPFRRVRRPRAPRLTRKTLPGQDTAVRIIRILAARPGCTDEVTLALGQPRPTVQANLSHLRGHGVIEPSGSRGLSRFGKPAVRWRLRPGPHNPDLPAKVLQALRECLAPQARSLCTL